jgi:hypothetical protein
MDDKLEHFCCPHCRAVTLQAYDDAYTSPYLLLLHPGSH